MSAPGVAGLLDRISTMLSDAVDDLERPDLWGDIPDVLAEVIDQRDAALTRLAEVMAERDAAREARHRPHPVGAQQIVAEWAEARQLLNDAGMSELSLPAAVAQLLPRDEDS